MLVAKVPAYSSLYAPLGQATEGLPVSKTTLLVGVAAFFAGVIAGWGWSQT
jgi:hypothetical protein